MTQKEIQDKMDVIETHIGDANTFAEALQKEVGDDIALRYLLQIISDCTNAAGLAISIRNIANDKGKT